MVGRQLADLRRRRAGSVRKKISHSLMPPGYIASMPGHRVRGVVLVVDAGAEVAIRDPRRLARPAAVDQLRLDRQHPPDGLDRLGRGRLPAGAKVQVTDLDPQAPHSAEDSVAADPGSQRPTISTHVLDTERGLPASGVRVTLYRLGLADSGPIRMTQALTDADGRVRDLLERPLRSGTIDSNSTSPRRTARSSRRSRSRCRSPTSSAATTCRCCWRRSR